MIKMCYLGINSCTLKFVGLDIALQELGEHAPRPAQLRECCRLSIGQTNCWQCWEILKVLDLLGYKILVLENPPNKHTKSGHKTAYAQLVGGLRFYVVPPTQTQEN